MGGAPKHIETLQLNTVYLLVFMENHDSLAKPHLSIVVVDVGHNRALNELTWQIMFSCVLQVENFELQH